jgi:osmoprotectant transport system ATP-binding protein
VSDRPLSDAPATADAVLEAVAVRKSWGAVVALDAIDLAVRRGECLALVGESGAGKTTLLRCFNRLVVPDRGSVRVNGVDVATVDPFRLRREIGYAQQDGGLLPHWRVLRNVALVPRLRGLPSPERLAARALERVGLPAHTYGPRWPRELSGGQRQRVALARALAAGPPVLLLDEPFGALDAITRGELHESFVALHRQLGVTTVLVTHDLREALQLADRVAVLRAGRIEQIASAAHLRTAPAGDYVRLLLRRAGLEVG